MQNCVEKPPKDKKEVDDGDGEEKKRRPIIKSATDLQRLKLEKLMKNPDKPIVIPETPKEKDYMQTVPSFVRNVMGSSAGAGSGEFHVYRHLRRKEYARQKCIQAKSMKEQLDDEYKSKLEKNRLEAEAKTAKKRAKRLKKKQRSKKPKMVKNDDPQKQNTSEDDEDENSSDKSVDVDAVEKKLVNDNNGKMCEENDENTIGPQPKGEITPDKIEQNQEEDPKMSLNTAASSHNNAENEKAVETKKLSKTKDDLIDKEEKQEAGEEELQQTTSEGNKDSTPQ